MMEPILASMVAIILVSLLMVKIGLFPIPEPP